MKKINGWQHRVWLAFLLGVFLLAFPAAVHAADPVVSNITAAQRAGTKLVDISYDLTDADSASLSVTLLISSDGGATWTVPAVHATGAIGAGVAPGTGKKIVWDAGVDWNARYTQQMRFRITADDGSFVMPANMILIPAGSFLMGDANEEGESDELPVHTVTLSAFYLDKYEVTKALWDEVKNEAANRGYSFTNSGFGTASNHPVHTVNWFDVVKWLNARSEKEGRTPVYYTDSGMKTVYRTGEISPTANWTANGYRLPTEAEWEYAARAGTTTRFYTGNCISSDTQANFDGAGSSYGCLTGQSRGATTAVGSFPANPWGLFDMAGNVWEWTWDWNGAYSSTAQSNPRGPSSGSNRVLRGGSWSLNAAIARSAYRSSSPPKGNSYSYPASSDFGFRSALSQP